MVTSEDRPESQVVGSLSKGQQEIHSETNDKSNDPDSKSDKSSLENTSIMKTVPATQADPPSSESVEKSLDNNDNVETYTAPALEIEKNGDENLDTFENSLEDANVVDTTTVNIDSKPSESSESVPNDNTSETATETPIKLTIEENSKEHEQNGTVQEESNAGSVGESKENTCEDENGSSVESSILESSDTNSAGEMPGNTLSAIKQESLLESRSKSASEVLNNSPSKPQVNPEGQQTTTHSTSASKGTSDSTPSTNTSSAGQWTRYIKLAVANVEQTLDKVIQETATSEVGSSHESFAKSNDVIASEPPASEIKIQAPQPVKVTAQVPKPHSGRLSMQERLAMALGGKNSPSGSRPTSSTSGARDSTPSPTLKTPISSPRVSLDQKRPSSIDIKRSPSIEVKRSSIDVKRSPVSETVEKSETRTSSTSNPPIKSPPQSVEIEVLQSLISALPEGTNRDQFEAHLNILTSKESTLASEVHTAQEKINSLESKLKFLSREEAQRAKQDKSSSSGIQRKLAEKEEQVALLLEEGQILSRNELKHMNTIKGLRARERDNDRAVKDAQRKQEIAEREVSRIQELLKSSQDTEKRLNENTKARSRAENENETLKREKQANLLKISALENDILVLREKNDEAVLAAQSKQLDVEKAHSSDLQNQLSQVQLELSVCKEQHRSEVSELDFRLKAEIEGSKELETKLRNDIRNLESRVEHFRAKSEELSSGTSGDNHVNLLRQIEVLQAQHDIATENWSGIESNLHSRIANLEQELEDNNSREAYLRKKVKSLTDNLKTQTSENESLNDQVDELKSHLSKLNTLHTTLEQDLADAKRTANGFESATEKLKTEYEKKLASSEEKLKIAVESLQQANQHLQSQQQLKGSAIERKKSNGTDPFYGDIISRSGSLSPFSQRFSIDEVPPFGNKIPSSGFGGRRASSKSSLFSLHTPQNMESSNNSSSSSFSLALEGAAQDNQNLVPLPTHLEDDDSNGFASPYSAASETFRMEERGGGGGGSTLSGTGGGEASSRFDKESVSTVGAGPSIQLVNRMSRTIRSLESELSNVKQDLSRMTLSKDEAVKDITRLMQETETLNSYKVQVKDMEAKIEEMSIREQTALEMLGEKSEQVQELRADVDDIKSMFKQQIEELIDRLAAQEKK